jgi:hypothetical protein
MNDKLDELNLDRDDAIRDLIVAEKALKKLSFKDKDIFSMINAINLQTFKHDNAFRSSRIPVKAHGHVETLDPEVTKAGLDGVFVSKAYSETLFGIRNA